MFKKRLSFPFQDLLLIIELKMVNFDCLFGVVCPTQELFTHMET